MIQIEKAVQGEDLDGETKDNSLATRFNYSAFLRDLQLTPPLGHTLSKLVDEQLYLFEHHQERAQALAGRDDVGARVHAGLAALHSLLLRVLQENIPDIGDSYECV